MLVEWLNGIQIVVGSPSIQHYNGTWRGRARTPTQHHPQNNTHACSHISHTLHQSFWFWVVRVQVFHQKLATLPLSEAFRVLMCVYVFVVVRCATICFGSQSHPLIHDPNLDTEYFVNCRKAWLWHAEAININGLDFWCGYRLRITFVIANSFEPQSIDNISTAEAAVPVNVLKRRTTNIFGISSYVM